MAGLCFALGVWQVERGKEKQELFNRGQHAMSLPPLSLNDADTQQTPFRAVTATGQYLPNQSFFLDNAMFEGRAGYDVITPFKLSGRDQVVLVNRGWVSAGTDRRVLPEISASDALRVIQGHLVAPKGKPMFTSAAVDQNQPLHLFVDLEGMQTKLPYPLLPWVLELSPESEPGLVQRPYLPDDSKVSMHQAYAIQWFVFAFFALLLSIYAAFKRSSAD